MPKLLNPLYRCFLLAVTLCLSLSLSHCAPPKQRVESTSPIEALTTTQSTEGFSRALAPRVFRFPQDAGPHPDFQTEWWYYTGNLADAEGRPFGFQLTFFRRALAPVKAVQAGDWPTEQIYFAHFTVSDIKNQRFYPFERWQRGSIDLAGAQAEPFRVWLDHWQIQGDPGGEVTLSAKAEGVDLQLRLSPLKPLVLQGNRGLSQKSGGAGNASYYYSRTRLASAGTLRLPGEPAEFNVRGLSWLDREWSTSVLSQEQTGWDWFSLQLPQQQELMLYQLRLKEGGVDRFSSGTFIDTQGVPHVLTAKDFTIEVTDTWTSPDTGIRYPSAWQLKVPAHDLELKVKPLMNNQELPLSFTYWEGAVAIQNMQNAPLGKGYVELTGYGG
jgi:predicted secreted hydrolase